MNGNMVRSVVAILLTSAAFAVGQTSFSTRTPGTTPRTPTTRRTEWIPPTEFSKEDIPDPRIDIYQCGRSGRRSWVCDPHRILTVDEGDSIDNVIEELRHSTGACHCEKQKKCPLDPNYGGWQAGVALVNKLRLPFNPSSAEKARFAEDVADHLRDDAWEFGVCNDDLVILVSREDRIVYTKTGDAMTPLLTDYCVGVIYKDVKPRFTDGNFALGIQQMLQQYTIALRGQHDCNQGTSTVTYIVIGVVILAFLAGVIVFSMLRNRYGWCPTSGGGGGGGHSGYHSRHHYHTSGGGGGGGSRRGSNSSGGGGGDF